MKRAISLNARHSMMIIIGDKHLAVITTYLINKPWLINHLAVL